MELGGSSIEIYIPLSLWLPSGNWCALLHFGNGVVMALSLASL